ncbi:hypothetical protein KUV73_04410 [Mameliella alba]|nr:hypothetical protein [Mameliella alba]MBY6169189.1 hypothetical protein [Mameliella alba]MBY6173590.1 hypothetical protein [Mameliella alba]
MAQEELARITASAPRRLIGVGAMMGLGGLMVYMGFGTDEMAMGWRGFLVLLGIAALFVAQLMWQVTGHALILTEEALTDSDGTVVARLDEIEKVDRGMFAMKPSNGFLVILKQPGSRIWRPGLWWRMGRRVAIGGVTAGSATKPVADIMIHLLSQRES